MLDELFISNIYSWLCGDHETRSITCCLHVHRSPLKRHLDKLLEDAKVTDRQTDGNSSLNTIQEVHQIAL